MPALAGHEGEPIDRTTDAIHRENSRPLQAKVSVFRRVRALPIRFTGGLLADLAAQESGIPGQTGVP